MENKSKKIDSIHIEVAENGFIYRAHGHSKDGDEMPMGMSREYVYENVEDVLAAVKDDLISPHMREYPSKKKMDDAFKEVHENEPEAVEKTRKKKGKEAAKRQLAAIAISKARGSMFK